MEIFTKIKEAYPESPFISFIEKELSTGGSDSADIFNNDLIIDKKTITTDKKAESEFKNYSR